MDQLGIGDPLAAAAAGLAARGERVAAPMIDQTNRGQVLALGQRPARPQALPGADELKPE